MKEVLELKFNSVVNISAKIEPNSSSSTGVSICPVLMMYIFIIICNMKVQHIFEIITTAA